MKDLFVAVKDYYLEPGPTKNLIDFCMNHQLSMTNLLLLGIRTYLSKVNNIDPMKIMHRKMKKNTRADPMSPCL